MELAKILSGSVDAYVKKHPLSEDEKERIQTVEDAIAMTDRMQEEWAAQPEPSLEGLSPSQYLLERASVQDWANLLFDWAEMEPGRTGLPKPLVEVVRLRLDELGPVLVGLIDDESLWNATSRGKGYVPSLAARVVGQLGYEPAVPPLLKVLEKVDEFTTLGDAAVAALSAIGEPAREGLYDLAERHKADVDGVPYPRAMELLTQLAQGDRTWEYLKRGLRESLDLIGMYIAIAGEYGDQRAVFYLNTLLEERSDLDPRDRAECLEGIEMLGGIPTARAKLAAAPALSEQNPFSSKIGRNDPCPCGSGKKYKKCHGMGK